MVLADLLIFILICFIIMAMSYYALSLLCGLMDELDKKKEESEDKKNEEVNK